MRKIDMDRRQFCTRLGAALATPALAGALPPSDRVMLGHIGVGGRGSSLLNSFLQLPDAQSIAICDPFSDRRKERAAQVEAYYASRSKSSSYRGVHSYRDFRDLLARSDIDAVVIATPDHWHVPIAVAAVRTGKDVYLEKPLGVSVSENQILREEVIRHGRIFQYGTQQRSERNFRHACELVRNGRIGDLSSIHAWCPELATQEQFFHSAGGSMTPAPIPPDFDYDLWLGPAPWTPYTLDRCTCYGAYHHYDNSLGFIAGWGAHPLDIAQWGNDSDETAPVTYEGTGEIASTGLYNSVCDWDVMCRYANGVVLRFMSQEWARPLVESYHPEFHDHGTTFIGTEGWVSVDRLGLYAQPQSMLTSAIALDEIHLETSSNHYHNFIQSVRTRRKAISGIEAAVQSDIICHLADIAVRTRRTIKWNPLEERIPDDPEAGRMLVRSYRTPWSC